MTKKGFARVGLTIVIFLALVAVAGAGIFIFGGNNKDLPPAASLQNEWSGDIFDRADSDGKELSRGLCSGEDKPKLGALPMRLEDFSMIVPYGLMVGGHVTPIDHQYFSPTVFNSPPDTYEVFAMADADIVDIEIHPPSEGGHGRIRLVFSMSCKLFYYYDLVTSLREDILSAYKNARANYRSFKFPVKEGEVIGRIGGQTLDFAVWDMDIKLPGFIVPEHYVGESWKIHTADPLDYYTEDLKKAALSKYVRTVPPVSGKIDYDIDGKLIGNWFVEGAGGYGGGGEGFDYFKNHLSFAPDLYDPRHFVISIGSLYNQTEGETNMQHMTLANSPLPEDVGVETGLVKYDLVGWEYLKADGSPWNGFSLTKGPTVKRHKRVTGSVLVQMIGSRKLKFEVFPGKTSAEATSFTAKAKIYGR